MVCGIIYEYEDLFGSAYVGKAQGLYNGARTLKAVHRRHLRGHDPVPFDIVLRTNESCFEVRIVDEIFEETAVRVQAVLKGLEKRRIAELNPRYNVVRG